MASAFRKELAISAQAPVGKKDLKTLRKDVASAFPRLTLDQLDAVLPLHGEWSALKLKTSGTILYVLAGRPPAFFDLEGRGDLYPSLFTLWALPEMLPTLETHGPVSKPLLKGADLMLPGVLLPEGGQLPAFAAGAKLAVRVTGNAAAVGVGVAALSSAEALACGMKGKGIVLAHVFRDSLWAFGGRAVPNAGFKADEVEACADDAPDGLRADRGPSLTAAAAGGGHTAAEQLLDDDDEAAAGAAEAAAAGAPPDAGGGEGGAEAEVVVRLAALSMDELLLETFLNAAATSLGGGKGLPIDSAELYAKHMQLAKPAQVPLDAKRSSYKQAAKFFKAQAKAKLITAKEHKGEIKVTHIHADHPLLAGHTPSWPLATPEGGPGAGGAAGGGASAGGNGGGGGGGGGGELEAELAALVRSGPPSATELVGPTSYLARLWAEAGLGKGQLLGREEAFEKILFAYVDKHGLEEARGGKEGGGAREGGGAQAAARAGAAAAAKEAQGGGGEGEAEETAAGCVRLDELLVECLWKVAGGRKKGGGGDPTSASMEECEVSGSAEPASSRAQPPRSVPPPILSCARTVPSGALRLAAAAVAPRRGRGPAAARAQGPAAARARLHGPLGRSQQDERERARDVRCRPRRARALRPAAF